MIAKQTLKGVILVILFSLLLVGCGSSRAVTRRSADADVDLSGKWNAKDSQLLAKKLIQQIVNEAWLDEFVQREKRKPVVIPFDVKNRTSEHIATRAFLKDIERALVNSRKVRMVSSRKQRKEVRAERADQQAGLTASPAELGKELGADFILTGELNLIQDRAGNTEQRFYQGNMELTSVVTNEVVWIGEEKINKVIDRRKTRF